MYYKSWQINSRPQNKHFGKTEIRLTFRFYDGNLQWLWIAATSSTHKFDGVLNNAGTMFKSSADSPSKNMINPLSTISSQFTSMGPRNFQSCWTALAIWRHCWWKWNSILTFCVSCGLTHATNELLDATQVASKQKPAIHVVWWSCHTTQQTIGMTGWLHLNDVCNSTRRRGLSQNRPRNSKKSKPSMENPQKNG